MHDLLKMTSGDIALPHPSTETQTKSAKPSADLEGFAVYGEVDVLFTHASRADTIGPSIPA